MQAWAVMHYLWNKQPQRMASYLLTMEKTKRRIGTSYSRLVLGMI